MGQSELHDYTTWRGRVLQVSNRINVLWFLPAIGFVIIVALLALTSRSAAPKTTQNSLLTLQSSTNTKKPTLQRGHYIYEANSDDELFPGLDSKVNKSEIIHLDIRKAVIDLNVLAECLDGAVNLQSIQIIAQDLTRSHGRRVHLPNLQQFQFTYTPRINADEFKSADILKDIMLFEKFENQEWDFHKDVLNLDVHIVIVVDGTTLLEVDRKTGRININIHFCSEILNYVDGEFTSLALSWCSLSNVSLAHPSLKYLNLNNAIPRRPEKVSALVKSLTKLEELHMYQPYLGQDDEAPDYYWSPSNPSLQIPVNLNEFPLTLKKLSICRLALVSASSYVSLIEDLSLEESHVAPIIVNNLVETFPNLTTVRLFSMPTASRTGWGPKLLLQVLKSNATKIVVTGFARNGSQDANVGEIDRLLMSYGLTSPAENFVVIKNITGLGTVGTARAMTYLETNYKRYESMGFDDIDTYGDYLLYDAIDSPPAGQACLTNSVIIVSLLFLLTQRHRLLD